MYYRLDAESSSFITRAKGEKSPVFLPNGSQDADVGV